MFISNSTFLMIFVPSAILICVGIFFEADLIRFEEKIIAKVKSFFNRSKACDEAELSCYKLSTKENSYSEYTNQICDDKITKRIAKSRLTPLQVILSVLKP